MEKSHPLCFTGRNRRPPKDPVNVCLSLAYILLLGYSDWATADIDIISSIWYRLSRRGPDFLVESSFDGVNFKQMRIFHLHELGETIEQMGQSNPPLVSEHPVTLGVYACSPTESSFVATFSEMKLEPSYWKAHK